jgi:hypothetical protein
MPHALPHASTLIQASAFLLLYCLIAYGLWLMAYGLWLMAYGLWLMAYGLWQAPSSSTA